ncbi:MAG: hypothetical protein IAE81_17350 [Caldilineaceae bacterium]|nr:hypothetical protein [Caldilineaceae bacterium]
MLKTGAELLESGERFAVTMWEYSWLVQREGLKTRSPVFGPEDEYRDWDKVLDELVERGYNCIRIDAHPHLIAAGPAGERQETFIMLPIADNFMWGNHEPVVINPRQGLIEFMGKCKERGIYIGLSSWYNDDETHRKLTIASPEDYARIWKETLDALNDADLLDLVVWVDICNEFPLPVWTPAVFADIFGPLPENEDVMAAMAQPWQESAVKRFNEYLNDTISSLRTAYPNLKYTFSLTSFGVENIVQKADLSAFDVLEPHIWTTDDMEWAQASGMWESQEGDPQKSLRRFVEQVRALYPESRERCRQILDHYTGLWADLARRNDIPLITTEAWTMIFYEDISPDGTEGEWEWFKEIAEIGVQLAIAKGWQGICTSNFCQPHFEGMWRDVAWHRRMTSLIRG